MNPLSFFAPYKLLIEVVLIGALFAGIAFGVHRFLEREQKIGYDKAVAEYAVKLADAKEVARQKDIANAKLEELRELQKENPIVNWQTFNNKKTGEFMLDFLTSQNSGDGQYIEMAERSIYRYVMVTAKSGEECGVLLGITVRSYGDDVAPFMAALKTKAKLELMRNIGLFKIPELTLRK